MVFSLYRVCNTRYEEWLGRQWPLEMVRIMRRVEEINVRRTEIMLYILTQARLVPGQVCKYGVCPKKKEKIVVVVPAFLGRMESPW